MDKLTDNWESYLEFLPREMKADEAIGRALAILFSASQVDGAHHKTWVLDQAVRALTGENYENFVNTYRFAGIEDVTDPEELSTWETISSGNYYPGDYPHALVEKVEAGAYSWDEGTPP